MSKRLSLIAAGAALATLGANNAAQAIVSNGPFSTTAQEAYGGTARLDINYGTGTATCSGTLLPSGQHILTAAHCFTDRNGNFDVLDTKANFWGFIVRGPNTRHTVSVEPNGYYIFPGWDGFSGGDIAVLKLSSVLPSNYPRADIYRGTDEVGQNFRLVGFGKGGLGTTGATEGIEKRYGSNQVDIAMDGFGPIRGSQLLFDFDDGTPQRDTSGQIFGVNQRGVTLEGMIAFGDSGTAAVLYYPNQILGVASYILSPGNPLDNDDQLNSSYGELAGMTRVSSYAGFIDDAVAGRIAPAQRGQSVSRSTTSGNVSLISYNQTNFNFVNIADLRETEVSVPEPTSALGLLAASLSGIGLLNRKRKRSSESQQSS